MTTNEAVREPDTLYLRNKRPNRVVLKDKQANLQYVFERRGTREDCNPLPIEAKRNRQVQKALQGGYLEEITEEEFFALGDLHRPHHEERDPGEPAFKKQSLPGLPLGDYNAEIDMKMPYVVPKKHLDDRKFKQEHMAPKLEFAEEQPSTTEELATKKTTKPRAKKET